MQTCKLCTNCNRKNKSENTTSLILLKTDVQTCGLTSQTSPNSSCRTWSRIPLKGKTQHTRKSKTPNMNYSSSHIRGNNNRRVNSLTTGFSHSFTIHDVIPSYKTSYYINSSSSSRNSNRHNKLSRSP